MDKEKLKLIVKNMKSLVDAFESEVYSDVDAYRYENYNEITQLPELEYDEVFEDDVKVHGHNYALDITLKGNINPGSGFAVNISSLKKIVNNKVIKFLDVEFNLFDGSYRPYLKEGDTPLYVNLGSNHPPLILKNIPASINRRLSALSSSEAKFDSVKSVYQEALAKAGYNYQPPWG